MGTLNDSLLAELSLRQCMAARQGEGVSVLPGGPLIALWGGAGRLELLYFNFRIT